MKNDWVGAICSVLFVIMFVIIICQTCVILELKKDYDYVQKVYEIVKEHDRIMKAYEFYNWHYSLQFFNEDEGEEK